MFRYKQRMYFLGRGLKFVFPLVCIAALLSFLIPVPAHAQPTGYQEYYVLGYEEHVWRAFLEINDGDDSGIQPGQICSTVSLVATADYQVVYYDHWEDGYEADLFNPTQNTTEIYGDGDTGNGGTGSDILYAGDALKLTSDQDLTGQSDIAGYVPVNPARDPAYIRYDGGDRIITSGGPVGLTHALWPLNASWVGGAWEVYPRQTYAATYSYRLPVGEDLYDFGGGDTGAYGDLRDVYLQLGAFEDNTTVSVNNGIDVVNLTLDRGQTYSSMGYVNSSTAPTITINAGTTIRSNKPTQVGLMTGADGSFQGRFLIVLPDQQWGGDYVVPVPRGNDTDEGRDAPAEIYLSNPNDFPVTVNAYDAEMHTAFVIAPTDRISATTPYSQKRGDSHVPQDSAARFTSPDGVFGVVVCADTSGNTYDWGFSGIPARYLTRDYYIPWSPGTTDLSDNGSPVWVTPLADDTVFSVDFSPLDGVVDQNFTLDVLEQRRIFDPDNDNTGMHVWATGEFAVAWGADPRVAKSGAPYLDLGFTTLPLQKRWLAPMLTLEKTAQPTILPPAGGIVTFTLLAQSYGAPLVNVSITDTLPLEWTYVPDSARVTYPDGSTRSSEPAVDNSTLFWNLSTNLDLDQDLALTFQAQITDTGDATISINRGAAVGKHEYSDALFIPRDEATVYISPLGLVKSVDSAQAGIGDTLVYTLSYANRDNVPITGVLLRDVVAIQYVTFQSASDGGVYDPVSGAVTWAPGVLAPGASDAVTFTVTVNDFVKDVTVIENVGYINSDQTVEAGSNMAQTVVMAPSIEFTKEGPTVAERGQIVTYTLSCENVGGVEATGVAIRDDLPASMNYVDGSLAIHTGTGWQSLTDGSDGDRGAYISPTLVITPGTIAAGEIHQIRFAAQFRDDLPSGSLVLNSATLDRDLDIPRDSNLVVTRISDLAISKAAEQAAVSPGDVISYTLTYENTSETITQTNVYLREPIPDHTSLLSVAELGGGQEVAYSWDNGATWVDTLPITPATHIRWYDAEVPIGTQATVGFAVQVNDPLPEGAIVRNIAYISSTQTAEYIGGWIPSNQVEVATVDLWIEKSAYQPAGQASELISYTISYGNHGSADAVGVQILDTIPITYSEGSIWGAGADDSQAPDLLWNVGTVVAGASAQQVGYTVRSSGLAPGTVITNTAIISSAYEVKSSDIVTTVITTEADLTVAKSDEPALVLAGEVLTYTLVYSNTGPSDARDVTIVDTLPPGMTYGGVITAFSDPTQMGQLLTWYTPTMATNVSGTIVFTATVGSGSLDTITNSVTIASPTYDPDPANDTAEEPTLVTTKADLSVGKSASSDPIAAGAVLTYTLSYTNYGPSDAQDVTIIDTLPVSVTYGGVASVGVEPSFSGPTQTGQSLAWHAPLLAAGVSERIIFTVTVAPQAAVDVTLINNVAISSATYDPDLENNAGGEQTGITAEADLGAQKSGSPNPVVAGEALTYTLVYTNDGPSSAQDIVVTDTLPAGVTYGGVVTHSASLSDPTGEGHLLTWYVPILAAGETESVVFTVTVGADAEGTLTNSAVITSIVHDPDPDNNVAQDLTSVTAKVDLDVDKSSSPDSVAVGRVLTYTLVYTNHGPSDARGVVITDTLPLSVTFGGVVYVTPSLLGPTRTGQALGWYTPTLAAGASGAVVFTVTVSDLIKDGVIIENVGMIDSEQMVSAGSDTVQTIVLAPEVEFFKAGPTAAVQGQVVTYTLSYENVGGAQATGVAIWDALPDSVAYVAGSLVFNEGNGWQPLTDADDGDRGAYISPTLVITPGIVAAGKAGQVRFSVQFKDVLPPGSLVLNSATLDRDLDVPRESNIVATRLSDLLISKATERPVAFSGDVISYTVTYENASETTAQTDVYLLEAIPEQTTFVTATESGGGQEIAYSWDDGATWTTTLPTFPVQPVTHIRWYDAHVPTTTQVTVGFVVRVDDVLPENTTIWNTAYITSAQAAVDFEEWIPSNRVEVATVDLWIEKSANQSSALASDVVSYTISYGNRGSADWSGAQIWDTIPVSAAYSVGSIWGIGADDSKAPELSWDVGMLAAGDSRQVGYAVMLDGDLAPGDVITNTAIISGGREVETSIPATVTITTEADLTISKSGEPASVIAGETLTYTLVYTNEGPSNVQGVVITDTLPADVTYGGVVTHSASLSEPTESGRELTWYIADLAAGASGSVVFTVTVGADARDSITNSALIASATHDPVPDNNAQEEATIIIAEADLAVAKSGSPGSVVAGTVLTYTLVYANEGPSDAQNVIITDTLPISVAFGGLVRSPLFELSGVSGREVAWKAPTLAVGASGSIVFTVTVGADVIDAIVNSVVIASDAYDPYLNNNVEEEPTLVTTEADLTIAKSGSPDPVAAGAVLTYTLSCANDGPSDGRGIRITDTLPVSVTYGGIVSSPFPDPDEMGQELTWEAPVLAAGASERVVFTVTVASWADAGDILTNSAGIASATYDPDFGNNAQEKQTLVVTEADLTISKRGEPGVINAGQTLTYTLVYANEGPSDAQGIIITDTLPVSITYGGMVGVQPSALGPTQTGQYLIWRAPTLATGTSERVVFTATVAGEASGVLTNSVVIIGATYDPDASNNVEQEPTMVNYALAVTEKVVDLNGAPLYLGDVIEYRLGITNTRTYTQTNVELADAAPANTTLVAGSVICTPGARCDTVGTRGTSGGFGPSDFGGMAVIEADALDPGGVLTLTFRVTVNDEVSFIGGNIAVVRSDNQSARETAPVYPPGGGLVAPGLHIIKKAAEMNSGTGVEYRIAVTNTNAVYTQTNVAVSDPAPANTTPAAGSVACATGAICGESDGVVTATVGRLAPGGVLTLTFRALVNDEISSIGGNVATVASDDQNARETEPVYPPGVGWNYIYLPLVMRSVE